MSRTQGSVGAGVATVLFRPNAPKIRAARRPVFLALLSSLVCAASASALADEAVADVAAGAPTLGSSIAAAESGVRRATRADFGAAKASRAAHAVADWVLASGDAGGLPFLIVDKPAATLHVFDAMGRYAGSSPVLLGLARGDDSVPGIGERPMAQIRPSERITPAGRFVAEPGVNTHGEDIMWVDYDDAVSMHRVRATNPKERRLERLHTPTIEDNRISYGCINVPRRFYEARVIPAFSRGNAIVYVLPETRSVREQFGIGFGGESGA